MSAVGSISVVVTDVGNGMTKYTVTWTSDASGNVSGTSFANKKGRLRQTKFVPGSGGVQPSDLYDVTTADADGADVLLGQGANLSQSTASWNVPTNPIFVEEGTLTPVIANAGNAKQGTIDYYIGP